MKNWIDIIAVTLLIIFATLVFGAILLCLLPIFLAVLLAYWALGGKFSVEKKGKEIGYVRWFGFYRV